MLVLVIEFGRSTDRARAMSTTDYEVAWTQCLATFPARERRLRRVDLLTWSCKAGPNQRMRSRRSLTKEQFAERKGLASAGLKQNAKSN
jgi:hypothetical protein